MLGRVAIAVVLRLLQPAAATADDVALEWSVGDRLDGPTSIVGPFAQFCVFVNNGPSRRFDPDHPRREAPPGTDTAAQVERTALARLPAEYDALAARLNGHVHVAACAGAAAGVLVVAVIRRLRSP